jgi:hypothetical protein
MNANNYSLSMTKGSTTYDPDATPWNEADGIPWSDMTTEDLVAALNEGCTVEESAIYLQYSEITIRAKMDELGLKEQTRRPDPCR